MLGLVNRVKATEIQSGDTLILDGGFLVAVDEVGCADGHVMVVLLGGIRRELVFKEDAELNRMERIRYVDG